MFCIQNFNKENFLGSDGKERHLSDIIEGNRQVLQALGELSFKWRTPSCSCAGCGPSVL